MVKTIGAALQSDIQSNVTTLTTIVEIVRDDGATFRMTNHDEDITVNSQVYDHSIPFQVSANSSGTTLSVDNTELVLYIDDTIFIQSDFVNGAFKHAEVLVSLVDYVSPEDGQMIMRKGWFGEIVINEQKVAKISVSGLLKLLDFEVGRIYTPTCDTDLGSRRCGVAINDSQAYDAINDYHVGKWVKVYDKTQMTSGGLVNGDFSDDGSNRSAVQSIIGWTRGPDCGFQVSTAIGSGEDPPLPPPDGTYFLWGGTEADNNTTASSGAARYVYQDIDCVADAGMSTVDIDANELRTYLDPYGSSIGYLLDPLKVSIDYLDANGQVISTYNTGWSTTRESDTWNRFFVVSPVPALCRTMRVFLILRLNHGIRFNQAFNGIDLNWWNHTTDDPTNGVIHKCVRIPTYDDNSKIQIKNNGFEANGGTVANTSTANAITNWTMTSGSYWQVATTFLGQPVPVGSYVLAGGDDSSGTQQTYEIENTFTLEEMGIDAARADLGSLTGRIQLRMGWGDAVSLGGWEIEFFDGSDTTISVHSLALQTNAVGWYTVSDDFVIPVTTRYIVTRLKAQSAVGVSDANVMFDHVEYWIHDIERPSKTDVIWSLGSSGTVFSSTVGTTTIDGAIVWKVVGAHDQTDVVATVTDSKLFTGTTINGADGVYETAVIEWITGANAGTKNIIRTWNSSTKAIKLYFQVVNDIQVGDSFRYILPCHKRFLEDCALTFNNAVNFQGFPHLPSKI